MRSFAGRDILSLKDFERNEFFHVFDVALEDGADCARPQECGSAEREDDGDGLLPAVHPHAPGS